MLGVVACWREPRQSEPEVIVRDAAAAIPPFVDLRGVRLGMAGGDLRRLRARARTDEYTGLSEVVRGHRVTYHQDDGGHGNLLAVTTDVLPDRGESPVGAWHRVVGAVRARRNEAPRCTESTGAIIPNVAAVWDGAGYELHVVLLVRGVPPSAGPHPSEAVRAASAEVRAGISRPGRMPGRLPEYVRPTDCPEAP